MILGQNVKINKLTPMYCVAEITTEINMLTS